ncbi:MAG: MBL fold metallo-hydrolase [Candidatus Amulumruptor caecigallinarius]|nr:MBL fold metallo-hydrolase [Candidatus Amulumruptor caecigallinarius]
MIKITYVWHDCFVVGTDEATLIFDYWKDPVSAPGAIPHFLKMADAGKPLYVFVSHSHKDHFNPEIFSWALMFPGVKYVVSRDVMRRIRHVVSETSVYSGPKVDADAVVCLKSGEEWSDGVVKVAAFPSTDVGNSYVVETAGKRFFHSGDLNAWVWRDESDEKEINKALGDYHACLREIGRYLQPGDTPRNPSWIDYCFFPVDSRIGSGYYEGAAAFVREFDVRHFFPMHFGLGDAEEQKRHEHDAVKFELYANRERGEYIALTVPYVSYLDCC